MMTSESDNKLASGHVPAHLRAYGTSNYGAVLQHPTEADRETFLDHEEDGAGHDVHPSSSRRAHGGKLLRAVSVMGVLLMFGAAVTTAHSRWTGTGSWQVKPGGERLQYINGVNDMLAEVRFTLIHYCLLLYRLSCYSLMGVRVMFYGQGCCLSVLVLVFEKMK